MHRGKVGPVSPEQHEYLGDILTSSSHLLQLINASWTSPRSNPARWNSGRSPSIW